MDKQYRGVVIKHRVRISLPTMAIIEVNGTQVMNNVKNSHIDRTKILQNRSLNFRRPLTPFWRHIAKIIFLPNIQKNIKVTEDELTPKKICKTSLKIFLCENQSKFVTCGKKYDKS